MPNVIIEVIFILRYSAVCNPLSYKENAKPQNVNLRVFKYVFLVIIFSFLINFARFFEIRTVSKKPLSINSSEGKELNITYSFDVTDLRKDPDYIRYSFLTYK